MGDRTFCVEGVGGPFGQTCHREFWHANIVKNLELQRQAAVKYLESMAGRNSDKVAVPLRKAAEIYRQQLGVIGQMRTGIEITKPGKEQAEFVAHIRKAAALDLEAIGLIERAIPLFPSE